MAHLYTADLHFGHDSIIPNARRPFRDTGHMDPALIRPGRADVHVELSLIGAATARRLFERFFPEDAALAESFERRINTARLSPAAVQGWLLAHRDNPSTAARAEGLRPIREVAAGE